MTHFIAIEGVDGTGKATQTKLLKEWFEKQGKKVSTFAFPQYGQPSAALVEEYLQGNLGSEEEVGPYAGSMYYALDRFHAGPKIRQALEEGQTVICDRYVGSNMAHQGQKIKDKKKRHEYFKWNMQQEFEIFNIPKPDVSIVLTLPAEIAQNFAKREDKSGKGQDIHDQNIEHLRRSAETYSELCQLFPENFIPINCAPDDHVLGIEEIQQLIIGVL